jgi:hypothetical protein
MRPDRFQQLLAQAAASLPGVTVQTFEEAGHTRHPYGITVQAGGKTSRWQIVATSAPGDQYAQPEPVPVLGDSVAAPEPSTAPAGSPEQLEAALAIAVHSADQGEIAGIDLYSRRPDPPVVGFGATFTFHDGSRIYLNSVR